MTVNNKFIINLVYKSLKNSSLRGAVIAVCIFIGACVCAAFVNVYLDIDSKVSRELKTYGANMVFVPTDMTKNEFIDESLIQKAKAGIDKQNLIGFGSYLFSQSNIGPTDAIIMGVNFSSLKKIKPFLELREGSMINVDFDDKNALIGVDLAKQTGFKVGDLIDIRTAGSNKVTKVRIKGIVASGDKEDTLLIVSLGLAQEISNLKNKINYAEAVVLGSFGEIQKLSNSLSNDGFVARPVAKVSKSEGMILDKIKLLMALVSLVILLITSMCVNTTLSAIMLSRSKEIALMRALGASNKNILNLFSLEIFSLAFICSIFGAFFGYILAQILGFVIFDSSIDFRILSIPIAVFISLLFATIASFYPIKRALGANMAEILRGE
ncbi:ferrirhodotorulic acid ABC transporter, permease protein [Campylobacter pinnipediorum subsp. caledonicus]|uniref:Ferrirhodotorulic acid ABC transporter, permease protein n=1 Tax=Campylobacter pinnipediorum subsp. caledonicus TaxID=1874362 RepID=A0A1S6U5F7_9BACT|nr:FtsX-like permease family protein [Campylobacter pinnipediorum]AQW86910.1 ferrirhodotorulic acid ABC transporter, permease protein [Campylobacter pinnipediorum subsp. caledonicus]OPA71903.1 multidrug ABC transporter substrate-binding protein [Campylobacter pinnipediorum subsp. caledonicus]